ncbi:MAG: Mur ligase family protein [Candidatus Nealsonbacteria bacterium]
MKLVITILWFLIFTKVFLFWLWLWQLKEYHWGRFCAHFETQKWKKIISSFWRIKFPKFTPKTITILFFGILLESLILFYIFSLEDSPFYISLLILLILSPAISSLVVLFFQIPTDIFKNKILKRAQQKRQKLKDLLVIGITGSYGKTSTKEFLAEILSKKFKVLKTKKHINAEIGIAQAILNELTPEHEIFIAEIGAYERGKIKQVCEMLQPKMGILTGINEQHLSTFGSLKNIIEAKFELIESLPEEGLAVFNGNNRYCRELFQETKIPKKIVYPKNYNFVLRGKNLFPWDIENLSMAAATAEFLEVDREKIEKTLDEIENPIKIKKGIKGLTIINSTYSANPKSVISHLDYLKKRPGKKVIVMPCLIELGKVSGKVHKKIGAKIGQICDLAIITTKDNFKEIKEGAGEKAIFIENLKKILEKIKSFCREGDVILLESRLPSQLIQQLTINN